ncbi:MAG: pantetheine-phosphate adenylyltransferase [Candidatus Methylomirabilales bacterium]
MKRTRAVYPGTFDPFTNGHRDIVERALRIFPRMIVAVAANPEKSPLFTVEERMEIIRDAVKGMEGVRVDSFQTLLVDYAGQQGATVVIRGLRAVSDFEYEFQMALMNRRLAEEVEMVFLMPHEAYTYLSSRLVKEVAFLGGTVKGLVSPVAERMLREKYHQRRHGKR